MEYNTTQKKLILPEYGRNVQMMAEHLFTIEDREHRTKAAYELVDIMINMNPTVKETKDHKQKMWDYLAQICEYKLDVDFPFPITEHHDAQIAHKLPYNNKHIKYRHYGLTIENLIKAAGDYEEGEEKEALIKMIANHMKKTYVSWNQKPVNDSIIINDLYEMSGGKLKIDEETKLMHVSYSAPQPQQNNKKKKNNNNKKGRKK